MKKLFAATVVSLLVATPAMAWNPLKDAASQVKDSATTQAQATKDAQVQSANTAAQSVQDAAAVAGKRKALGKEAEGKTDAEVNALFDAKAAQGQAVVDQAKSIQSGETDVKAAVTQEATNQGINKLNKALGQ